MRDYTCYVIHMGHRVQKDAKGINMEEIPVGESKMMPFGCDTLANFKAKWFI